MAPSAGQSCFVLTGNSRQVWGLKDQPGLAQKHSTEVEVVTWSLPSNFRKDILYKMSQGLFLFISDPVLVGFSREMQASMI